MRVARKKWIQIHAYLSLFFLPVALLYAITGSLYIFGIKDLAGATINDYELEEAFSPGQEAKTMLGLLEKNNLQIPKNQEVYDYKGVPTMGSIWYNAALVKEKSGEYIMRTTQRSIYGILVLMHKSKGRFYFDVLAIGFAASLMFFYLSGLVATSFAKEHRKAAFSMLALGFIITPIAVFLSI